eukprot:gene25648-11311_t
MAEGGLRIEGQQEPTAQECWPGGLAKAATDGSCEEAADPSDQSYSAGPGIRPGALTALLSETCVGGEDVSATDGGGDGVSETAAQTAPSQETAVHTAHSQLYRLHTASETAGQTAHSQEPSDFSHIHLQQLLDVVYEDAGAMPASVFAMPAPAATCMPAASAFAIPAATGLCAPSTQNEDHLECYATAAVAAGMSSHASKKALPAEGVLPGGSMPIPGGGTLEVPTPGGSAPISGGGTGGGHTPASGSKRPRPPSACTSSFRNVCWNKKNKRWQATLKYRGKDVYLGSFHSDIQAGKAADRGTICLAGCGKLNFPLSTYTNERGSLLYDPWLLSLRDKVESKFGPVRTEEPSAFVDCKGSVAEDTEDGKGSVAEDTEDGKGSVAEDTEDGKGNVAEDTEDGKGSGSEGTEDGKETGAEDGKGSGAEGLCQREHSGGVVDEPDPSATSPSLLHPPKKRKQPDSQTKPSATQSSPFRCVCWNKKNQRWQATIKCQKKDVYLGSYKETEEAARAVDLAVIILRGDTENLNFSYTDYIDTEGCVIPSALGRTLIPRLAKHLPPNIRVTLPLPELASTSGGEEDDTTSMGYLATLGAALAASDREPDQGTQQAGQITNPRVPLPDQDTQQACQSLLRFAMSPPTNKDNWGNTDQESGRDGVQGRSPSENPFHAFLFTAKSGQEGRDLEGREGRDLEDREGREGRDLEDRNHPSAAAAQVTDTSDSMHAIGVGTDARHGVHDTRVAAAASGAVAGSSLQGTNGGGVTEDVNNSAAAAVLSQGTAASGAVADSRFQGTSSGSAQAADASEVVHGARVAAAASGAVAGSSLQGTSGGGPSKDVNKPAAVSQGTGASGAVMDSSLQGTSGGGPKEGVDFPPHSTLPELPVPLQLPPLPGHGPRPLQKFLSPGFSNEAFCDSDIYVRRPSGF